MKMLKRCSIAILRNFPGLSKFDGSYIISVENVEFVYPRDLGVSGFFEIRIKPKN